MHTTCLLCLPISRMLGLHERANKGAKLQLLIGAKGQPVLHISELLHKVNGCLWRYSL